MEIPSTPPGFEFLTSFKLQKVDCESSKEGKLQATFDPIDIESLQRSLKRRPWILHDQSNDNKEGENNGSAQPCNDCPPARGFPKGVICERPDCSESVKVTAKWHPEEAIKEIIEEVPVFCPTEEEFRDTLVFIASIRPKAEPYGICRIVPPPCWKPPCLMKQKDIWEDSKFAPEVQHIAGFQSRHKSKKVTESYKEIDGKRRRSSNTGLNDEGNYENRDFEKDVDSSHCLEFTLQTFDKYAEDFKNQYFYKKDRVSGSIEPTVESIEGEYRRITENSSEEVEVLHGRDLSATNFGSGFPEVCHSPNLPDQQTDHMRTGWNLNNLPTLPGSLLAHETRETSQLLVPRLQVGMCFSSQCWKVEEHHLYSLHYMHDGSPKVVYGVPGSCCQKFEAVMKKHCPGSFGGNVTSHNRRVGRPAISTLKSEDIPVYRCVQYPGEFVLIFPGAYHSAFDCGFNCTEEVNFAPLDWLPHGHNAAELYRVQRRKTSLSYDKILVGVAQDAVQAHWLSQLGSMVPYKLLKWRDVCKKDGILGNAMKLLVKRETITWKYLCTSLELRRMDKSFDASCKRECCICFCDLHIYAVGCGCSAERYSCLSHAKQFCSCPWSSKFAIFRYTVTELDILVEAVNGKVSSLLKWAKEYLGLNMHAEIRKNNLLGKNDGGSPVHDELNQNEKRNQDKAASIRAEVKALIKARSLNNRKAKEVTASSATVGKILDKSKDNTEAKENTTASSAISSKTIEESEADTRTKETTTGSSAILSRSVDYMSIFPATMTFLATDSSSESSSSDSDMDVPDICFNISHK